jgi:hypothetical protein
MRGAISCAVHLIVGIVAVAVVGVCLLSNAEEPGQGAPPAARKWFVELGPFWRDGGDVNLQVRSLPAIPYTRPSAVPTGKVGPADRVADRQYNDGYVRMDYGTGVWDKDTWYWGYQNQNQVVGDHLMFHGSTFAAGGQTISPRDAFSVGLDDEFGWEARVGRSLFDCKCFTGSLLLGLGFTSFGGSGGFDDLGYLWSSQGGLITDTYDLLTDPDQLPAAPYSGTKEGPGYMIPNIPSKREISGGSGSGVPLTQIFHSVRQDLDVDLWVVSLGLDLRGKGRAASGKPSVSYLVGAGLTGNFVSAKSNLHWAAKQNGTTLDSASFSGDDCTAEFGVYGEAGVLLRLSERISVSVRGRYDHVFDDAEVSFPNGNAEIDLSGASAVAGIGISL